MAMKPAPRRSRRGNRLPDNSYNRRPVVGRPVDYSPKRGFEPSPNEGFDEAKRLQCSFPGCDWDPTHLMSIPYTGGKGQVHVASNVPVCNHHRQELTKAAQQYVTGRALKESKIEADGFHFADGTVKSAGDLHREQRHLNRFITATPIGSSRQRKEAFKRAAIDLPIGKDPRSLITESEEFKINKIDYESRQAAQALSKSAQEGLRAALPEESNPSDSIHNSRKPRKQARLLKGANVPLVEATAIDKTGKPYNFRPERRDMMSAAGIERRIDGTEVLIGDESAMEYEPRSQTAGVRYTASEDRQKAHLEEVKRRRPKAEQDQAWVDAVVQMRRGKYKSAEELAGGRVSRAEAEEWAAQSPRTSDLIPEMSGKESMSIAELRQMTNAQFMAHALLSDNKTRMRKVGERKIRSKQGGAYEFPYEGLENPVYLTNEKPFQTKIKPGNDPTKPKPKKKRAAPKKKEK